MTASKERILKGVFHHNVLQAQRKKAGWTQGELALRVGVRSVATIFNWESGLVMPKRNHLRKLASVFQVSISTFYTEQKDIR